MNKKHLPLKKYAFTLIELVFVAMIIALIMPEMFSLYNFIIKSNREIIARQQAIQQWYEFFERLNILMEDYTIDYEEYYNRQMVWCSKDNDDFWRWGNFKRNVGLPWYCKNFTAYGNENSNLNETQDHQEKFHDLYYCSSETTKNASRSTSAVIMKGMCGHLGIIEKNYYKQSYGQYATLFKDVKGGKLWVIVWSDDDVELWYLITEDVDAIKDSENIQELYLISHDWKKRLYFRRKLDKEYEEEFTDGTKKKYRQYKIQMLRLRWFDAWRKHNFNDIDDDNKWLYDGVIDTWACDTSMWFEPEAAHKTHSVWWAYPEYYLPQDEDDCWVDLTHWTTDLFAWNISISPIWDADLYWAKQDHQINSYMKIFILNKIYFPAIVGSNKRISSTITDFEVPLETTINMKDFYRNNS